MTYFTTQMAQALKPGETLRLGYNDFNVGRFTYTHIECFEGNKGIRCKGRVKFSDGEEIDIEIYDMGGVMRSGSGAERLFFAPPVPKKFKSSPAPVSTW